MGSRPVVLVIAASDSSGGAGLTRDVQTLTDWQADARVAVTAVTVQTDRAWRATQALPAALVRAQIEAALQSGRVGAIKIGMLATADIVEAVADALPARESVPVVLDPVLASTSGGRLLEAKGVERLVRLLVPRVTLLTPNLPEAGQLLGEAAMPEEESACEAQLARLLALGPAAVLLKGGHALRQGPEVVDRLGVHGRPVVTLSVPRAPGQRRGSGCSAASAIAAQLALGTELEQACRRAQAYVARSFAITTR